MNRQRGKPRRLLLDMCALKRPFDDQSQDRIRLETEAIALILMQFTRGEVRVAVSPSLLAENRQNPVSDRREKVERLLREFEPIRPAVKRLRERSMELHKMGLTGFDAVHVASADLAKVDYFITTDDDLLKRAHRAGARLKTKVRDPLAYLREVT